MPLDMIFGSGYWCSSMVQYVMIFNREGKLVEQAKALEVNAGTEPSADVGPVISKQVIFFMFLSLMTFKKW